MKKKILIASCLGGIAAFGGISSTLVTSTSIQSQIIDSQDSNQTNPDDKGPETPVVNPDDKEPETPVVNPDDKEPTTPVVNPDDKEPETPEILSVVPENDVCTFKMDLSSNRNDIVDRSIYNVFELSWQYKGKLLQFLKNSSQYQNVKVSYLRWSADVSSKTFKVLAVSTDGAKFADLTTQKTILVNITEL